MNTFNTVAQDYNKYIQAVGAKVTASMDDIKNSCGRTVGGFNFAADRIVTSASNLWQTRGQNHDAVQALFKGFSESPALQNVGNVAGVDVVDINIAATTQSILGYISAERGLDQSIATLWFQGVKAINKNFEKTNGWVNRPYMPMDKAIRDAVRGTKVVVENGDAIPETAAVKTLVVLDSSNKVIGRMIDGELFANDGTAIVDGKVVFGSTAAKAVVEIDKTTEKTGENTLKIKPVNETVQVTAQPRRIILEQSFEDLVTKINK